MFGEKWVYDKKPGKSKGEAPAQQPIMVQGPDGKPMLINPPPPEGGNGKKPKKEKKPGDDSFKIFCLKVSTMFSLVIDVFLLLWIAQRLDWFEITDLSLGDIESGLTMFGTIYVCFTGIAGILGFLGIFFAWSVRKLEPTFMQKFWLFLGMITIVIIALYSILMLWDEIYENDAYIYIYLALVVISLASSIYNWMKLLRAKAGKAGGGAPAKK